MNTISRVARLQTGRKLLIALLSAILGLASMTMAAKSGDAIDFVASGLDGETYRAHERLKGRVVLLDFWATWCGPCVQAMPKLGKLRDEFAAEGFEVVGLASYSGTARDVRRFLAKRPATYPIVMADEDVIEKFSVIGYPTYFLIDRDGKIAETYVGEIESQLDQVRDRIRSLLNSR